MNDLTLTVLACYGLWGPQGQAASWPEPLFGVTVINSSYKVKELFPNGRFSQHFFFFTLWSHIFDKFFYFFIRYILTCHLWHSKPILKKSNFNMLSKCIIRCISIQMPLQGFWKVATVCCHCKLERPAAGCSCIVHLTALILERQSDGGASGHVL